MSNTNRGKNPGQQSFQDLMAQRYPQPNRANNPQFQQQQSFQQPPQPSSVPQMNVPNQQYQQPNMQYPPSNAHTGGMPPYGSSTPMQPPPKGGMAGPPSTFPNQTPKTSQPKASSSTKKSDPKNAAGSSGLSYNTSQQNKLLSYCEWKDKVLWASRLILGGNSINGFLRATATAQRIKKQRARQSALAKKTAASASGGNSEAADKRAKPVFDQVEEEKLKKDIMNPRTAKKIKSELEAGIEFCTSLHNVLRSVLFEVDPSQSQYFPPPLNQPALLQPTKQPVASPQPAVPHDSNMPWTVKQNAVPKQQRSSMPSGPDPIATSATSGNAGASTLRKSRRKKLPPSNEPPVNLPEFDSTGKRVCTKKEHNFRLFELLRFRALRQGDFVAARLSSRELWILAKVLKDYPGHDMAPVEFLNLTDARRDAVFREKVLVRDVEEKDDGGTTQVPRHLVLPLPRTYSEAADWGQRCKKGSRVYAMYPETTSLYPATVIDSTTYCRDDDDIIVVEFDGEEQDATGQVPQYHIPARFVTLIPREFPASQENSGKQTKRRTTPKKGNDMDDFLSMDFGGDGLGNFDSLVLDFDAPLAAGEEMDESFPMI
eukprot:scaffold319_cov97-Cylindrotheca_fusiformis.AAC.1